MELKDIAAVAGKPGLFKVVKPARTGLLLESLDGKNARMVTGPSQRVSLLSEISMYTVDPDVTLPLIDLFRKIRGEFGDDPGVDTRSDKEELEAFVAHIAPKYDPDRVYPSDIRKLVNWYLILKEVAPEVLDAPAAEEKPEEKEDKKESEAAAAPTEAAESASVPKKSAKSKKKTTE
jgi:hypothetical protein